MFPKTMIQWCPPSKAITGVGGRLWSGEEESPLLMFFPWRKALPELNRRMQCSVCLFQNLPSDEILLTLHSHLSGLTSCVLTWLCFFGVSISSTSSKRTRGLSQVSKAWVREGLPIESYEGKAKISALLQGSLASQKTLWNSLRRSCTCEPGGSSFKELMAPMDVVPTVTVLNAVGIRQHPGRSWVPNATVHSLQTRLQGIHTTCFDSQWKIQQILRMFTYVIGIHFISLSTPM